MKTSVLLSLALILSACRAANVSEDIILIENTTAIDALNGKHDNVDIVIVNDKIVEVTPTGNNLITSKAKTVIDGTGKYIIPGLWDAHVHLSYNENIDYKVFFPLSIAHGVTYLRDTGGHLDKLEDARALSLSNPNAPDLYVSGPLLDGPLRVYDGSSSGFPDISVGLTTEKMARDYVDELAENDVSFVKAYEMLPPEIFAAIGDQAEKHGLPVAMHIPLSMTAEEAVAAGADDMQHLRNIELSCAQNSDELMGMRRDQIDQHTGIEPNKLRSQIHNQQRELALANQSEKACSSLLSLLAEEDVYQTPTLTISRFFTRRLFEDEDFRRTFEYMPDDITSAWLSRSERLKNTPISEASKTYDDWIGQTLPKMAKTGVPIMAGTDAPIAFLTPGASLHEELVLLVEGGLSPLQTLRAATYEPARFLGLELTQGTIAPDMKADLVILTANPLSDIQNIKQIEGVIRNGTHLDRTTLDNLLAQPSE